MYARARSADASTDLPCVRRSSLARCFVRSRSISERPQRSRITASAFARELVPLTARASGLAANTKSWQTEYTSALVSVRVTTVPSPRISTGPRNRFAAAIVSAVDSVGCQLSIPCNPAASCGVRCAAEAAPISDKRLRTVSASSSPSSPMPVTQTSTGTSRCRVADNERASASGLLSVGSSPTPRMSPPTSMRTMLSRST